MSYAADLRPGSKVGYQADGTNNDQVCVTHDDGTEPTEWAIFDGETGGGVSPTPRPGQPYPQPHDLLSDGSDTSLELQPLAPRPLEIVLGAASVVAVLFAVFAAYKVITRQWDARLGVGLVVLTVVLTVVVPFGGPILLAASHAWRVVRVRRAAPTG